MLDREEYIEQAYLFRTLGERMRDGAATQEALVSLGHEVLATTKLPLAIDYLVMSGSRRCRSFRKQVARGLSRAH